jgi:hypothetical protein
MTLQGLSGKKAVFFIEARRVLTLGLFFASRGRGGFSYPFVLTAFTFILPIPKLGLFCIFFMLEGSRWEVAKVHRYRGTKVQRCKVAEVQSCRGAKLQRCKEMGMGKKIPR